MLLMEANLAYEILFVANPFFQETNRMLLGQQPEWNFQQILNIKRMGKLIHFNQSVEPDSSKN